MKLKLEVVHVDPNLSDAVVLKPFHCGLEGTLVYRGLPKRAIERFKQGAIVEAEIPLPDYYPSPNEGRDLGDMAIARGCPDAYSQRFGEYPITDNVARIASLVRHAVAGFGLNSGKQAELDRLSEELDVIAAELQRRKDIHIGL